MKRLLIAFIVVGSMSMAAPVQAGLFRGIGRAVTAPARFVGHRQPLRRVVRAVSFVRPRRLFGCAG